MRVLELLSDIFYSLRNILFFFSFIISNSSDQILQRFVKNPVDPVPHFFDRHIHIIFRNSIYEEKNNYFSKLDLWQFVADGSDR